MDTFREPTLEEAKMLALQFMGQNLGEIKELDKNIIGKTNTLKGNTLNVQNILNSIPVQQQAPVQQAQQLAPRLQQSQINTPSAAPQFSVAPAATTNAVQEALDKISSQLNTIIKLLDK
jgi:hypothetical protein